MRRVVLRQARTGGKHAWGECAGRYPHHGQSSCRCANQRRGEKVPRAAPRRDFPTPQSSFKPDWRSDPSSYWRPGGCPRMTSSLRGRDSQRRTRASHGGGGVRGGWGRTAAVVSDRSHVFACPRSRWLRPRAQSRLVRAGESGAPVSSSRDNTWTGHNRHVFVSCGLCAVGVAVRGRDDGYLEKLNSTSRSAQYETGFSLRTVSRV